MTAFFYILKGIVIKKVLAKKNLESFGCKASLEYKQCFIIDAGHCLTVNPVGEIRFDINYLFLTKTYSRKRLSPPYIESLISDITHWLTLSDTPKKIRHESQAITKYIFKQLTRNVFKYLFEEFYITLKKLKVLDLNEIKCDATLREFEAILKLDGVRNYVGKAETLIMKIAISILTQTSFADIMALNDKNKDACESAILVFTAILAEKKIILFDLIQETLQTLLRVIFNPAAVEALVKAFKTKRSIDLNFIMDIIKQDSSLNQQLTRMLYLHIGQNLKVNKTKVKTQMAELKLGGYISKEFSATEIQIIDQLERNLTPREMRRLEAKQVSIIATDNPPSSHYESRGIFDPIKNMICVTKKNIESSLIHEVQHSLGFDVNPKNLFKFFKFYHRCKDVKLTFAHGLSFQMVDLQNILALEKNLAEQKEITKGMLNRAKYILTLPNYPEHVRSNEVLAHLRQFIADVGVEKVEIILPTLFNYWKKEILTRSCML